jgi:hypothetical protein
MNGQDFQIVLAQKGLVRSKKIGYINGAFIEEYAIKKELPKSQLNAIVYKPKTKYDKGIEIKNTDAAATTIVELKKTHPNFEGLIFEPQPGKDADINKAMKIYARAYNMPVACNINGYFREFFPC